MAKCRRPPLARVPVIAVNLPDRRPSSRRRRFLGMACRRQINSAWPKRAETMTNQQRINGRENNGAHGNLSPAGHDGEAASLPRHAHEKGGRLAAIASWQAAIQRREEAYCVIVIAHATTSSWYVAAMPSRALSKIYHCYQIAVVLSLREKHPDAAISKRKCTAVAAAA